MTTTTETQVSQRLQIGQGRDFPAGNSGKTVSVYQQADDRYRVTLIGLDGLAVECFTRTFDGYAGDLPVGMSGRQAANEYRLCILADFAAAAEQPAAVAARMTVDQQFTASPMVAKVSPAAMRAVAGNRDGVIARGNGVSESTLRALHRHHLGDLTYHTVGMRRIVDGLRLNGEGRRLADTVHTANLAA